MTGRTSTEVLVTGATGFLGAHVIHSLVENGYVVAGVRRSTSRLAANLLELPVEWVDAKAAASFIVSRRPAAVIHLATSYGYSESRSAVDDANVRWPLELLTRSLAHGAQVFVNTDTFFGKEAFSYGQMRPYIESKREFFKLASDLVSRYERSRFVSLRLEHVFGEFDGQQKFVSMLIRRLTGDQEPINLTPGNQRRDFVYAADVATAYITVLQRLEQLPAGRSEFEVGTGRSIPVRDFVEHLRMVCGGSRDRLRFGAIPHRDGEIMDSCANAGGLQSLGWQATWSLDEALARTVKASRG